MNEALKVEGSIFWKIAPEHDVVHFLYLHAQSDFTVFFLIVAQIITNFG